VQIDLSLFIQTDIERIAAILLATKEWKREDIGYFTSTASKWPTIVAFHEILYYQEENHSRAVPWVQLKFTTTENVDLAPFTQQIVNKLKQLRLTPFHDEDAFHGYFTHPVLEDGLVNLSCFVNPNFPKGMWYNHTLPYK